MHSNQYRRPMPGGLIPEYGGWSIQNQAIRIPDNFVIEKHPLYEVQVQ